jgi:hypothetical protein
MTGSSKGAVVSDAHRLSCEDRKAVLAILCEIKPNLPAWFQAAANP